MSIHLLENAALLDLPPSTKLAFMAFCDSADKDTGLAYPGLEQVMRWAGVGRSQAYKLMDDLIEAGYLARVGGGRKGRRAQFVVFAERACCGLHDPFIGSTLPDLSARPDPNKGSAAPDKSARPDPKTAIGSDIGSGKGSDSYRTPSQFHSYEEQTHPPAAAGGESDPAPDPDPVAAVFTLVDDDQVTDLFDVFYDQAYPRKEDRRAARRAWDAAIKRKVDPDRIIAAAREYARQSSGQERRYLKYPATWLNAGSYDNPHLQAAPPNPDGTIHRPGAVAWCGDPDCDQRSRLIYPEGRESSYAVPCPTCHPISVRKAAGR